MISRRCVVLTLAAGVFGFPLAPLAQAQPAPGVHRIGFLAARSRSTPLNPDLYYDAFVEGMRELGYVEGTNLVIEWRFADAKFERLPSLAMELVQLKPEVIVTHGAPPVFALQKVTSTIPVVTAAVADPVASGFAASLSRPGGNITGLSVLLADLSAKKLELIRLMIPTLSRVAIIIGGNNAAHQLILKNTEVAAQRYGMKLLHAAPTSLEEVERDFGVLARERAEAVIIAANPRFVSDAFRRQFVTLAIKHRRPTIFDYRDDVVAGGLMSYGQNLPDSYRRAASYVDRIFRGAKPGELPFEQPTRIHLAINRKTAKALGLAVPQELLLRADEVIE